MNDREGSQGANSVDPTRPAKLLFCWAVLLFGILIWVILLTAELLEGRWDGLAPLLQFVEAGLSAPLLALFFFVVGLFATSIGRGAGALVTLAGIVLIVPVLLLAGRPVPNVVAMPAGAVTMFLARDPETADGCPQGWVRAHQLDNRFAYGAPPISTDLSVADLMGQQDGSDSFTLEFPIRQFEVYLEGGTLLPDEEIGFRDVLVRTDGGNRTRIRAHTPAQSLDDARIESVRSIIPTMPPYLGVLFCSQDNVAETTR